MLNTKVKLKDLKTSQEYLLLVSKMNLKGVLVNTNHPLDLETPIRLSFQSSQETGYLELEGAVHKTVEHPTGGKGMIIRFQSLESEDLKKLQFFLEKIEAITQPAIPKQKGTPSVSREKTTLADIDSLSRIVLSSPDRSQESISSTRDEEAVHAAMPGLSGATKIYEMDNRPKEGRKGVKQLQVFFLILFLIAFLGGLGWLFFDPALRYINQQLGLTPPDKVRTTLRGPPDIEVLPFATPFSSLKEDQSNTQDLVDADQKPMEFETKPSSIPTKTTREALAQPGQITSIVVEDQAAFLKVTIKGQGNFSKNIVSRSMSPRRLNIDFPALKGFKVRDTIAVSKNPLLRIKTKFEQKSIRVTLDLYPTDFPKYDIKIYSDSMDIFLHRP